MLGMIVHNNGSYIHAGGHGGCRLTGGVQNSTRLTYKLPSCCKQTLAEFQRDTCEWMAFVDTVQGGATDWKQHGTAKQDNQCQNWAKEN